MFRIVTNYNFGRRIPYSCRLLLDNEKLYLAVFIDICWLFISLFFDWMDIFKVASQNTKCH